MRRLLAVALVVGGLSSAVLAKQPSSAHGRAPSPHKARKPQAIATPNTGATSQTVSAFSAVSYQNGLLTITAENSALQDILQKVRESTGATIDAPVLNERVTVRLGPQPPAVVIAALLEGSHLNYVLVGGGDQVALTAIQIAPEPAGGLVAAPPVTASRDADAAAAMAQARLIAQTGGDEGVWDSVEVGVPIVPTIPPAQVPAAVPSASSAQ